MKRVIVIFVCIACLSTGCSQATLEPSTSPVKTNGTANKVIITDEAFVPEELSIQAGDEVIWENQGSDKFTVTSWYKWIDDTSTEYTLLADIWDSGDIQPGDSYSRVFEQSGEYEYVSLPLYHWEVFTRGLAGKIIVE
jgi:plastocyanin